MVSSPILLDYQSSTPCLKEVVDAMKPYWSNIFANPSSKSNLAGITASAALEISRESIKNSLKLKNKRIIFTSGTFTFRIKRLRILLESTLLNDDLTM